MTDRSLKRFLASASPASLGPTLRAIPPGMPDLIIRPHGSNEVMGLRQFCSVLAQENFYKMSSGYFMARRKDPWNYTRTDILLHICDQLKGAVEREGLLNYGRAGFPIVGGKQPSRSKTEHLYRGMTGDYHALKVLLPMVDALGLGGLETRLIVPKSQAVKYDWSYEMATARSPYCLATNNYRISTDAMEHWVLLNYMSIQSLVGMHSFYKSESTLYLVLRKVGEIVMAMLSRYTKDKGFRLSQWEGIVLVNHVFTNIISGGHSFRFFFQHNLPLDNRLAFLHKVNNNHVGYERTMTLFCLVTYIVLSAYQGVIGDLVFALRSEVGATHHIQQLQQSTEQLSKEQA